jgi:tRNA uridine 5-carbamoylmethylation protein Kti12
LINRPTLYITRGLPGCGKTTRALAWIAENPHIRIRINRDCLRAMAGYPPIGSHAQEDHITVIQHAAILAALDNGIDVIADDTWLNQIHVLDVICLAREANCDWEMWDMIDVPIEKCVRRDANREKSVGEEVIRRLWLRYQCGKWNLEDLTKQIVERN